MAPLIDFVSRFGCRRFRRALVDLAEGSLPAAERAGVERHLAACPSCRDQLDDLRAAPSILRESESRPDDAEWLRQRRDILRLVRDLPSPRRTHAPLRLPVRRGIPASAGFAIAMAVVIAIVGYLRFEETFRPAIQLAETAGPLPNDIGALEAETVLALADVVEVITSPDEEALDLEHLSDAELATLARWVDSGFVQEEAC
jgi:anti-sigma factor RsiW